MPPFEQQCLVSRGMALLIVSVVLTYCACNGPEQRADLHETVRFATFNASLNRRSAGTLIEDLKTPDHEQARKIAEIIQRVRPDVILINEFDYDPDGVAARLFQENYLGVSQNGQRPLEYPYRFLAPVNTGIPSGFDLDNDGKSDGPADAFGFGKFPGQYGMVVYSMYPLDRDRVRTFQSFQWKDMPDAMLPIDPVDGEPYFNNEKLQALRLSSKSHWDILLDVEGQEIHFLVCHPTPPVFDGPEDRNGRRNHDEIRLFADYVDPTRSGYIYDDQGNRGGLAAGTHFVIAGDMNADPLDGDSVAGAALQLTRHPLIHVRSAPKRVGWNQATFSDAHANANHKSDPAHDTADFGRNGNLRVDYLLPSRNLVVSASGIFWPSNGEEGSELLVASDHRLVWLDINGSWR